MWNKYCKKEIPTVVQFRNGSHVWRKMLEAGEEVGHGNLWEINRGSTNAWHENWTGVGDLYHVLPQDFHINEELQEVAELRDAEGWNDQLLYQTFPENIAEHIRWMPTPSGKFSMSSARNILRHRDTIKPYFKLIWTKGLPFEISFFIWRLCQRKLPTDDLWRRNSYIIVSRCWCCQNLLEETLQLIFLTSITANRVWKTLLQVARLIVNLVQVHQVINTWWSARYCAKHKSLFQAVSIIITWVLWKRRNTMKNGDMITYFENYKPVVVTRRVTWQYPYEGWYKCNTDEASKDNLVYAKIIEGTLIFSSFHELLSKGKILINTEKAQIPGLRGRVAKKRAPN
ncbi:uncharacterized protein [Nicotiana tomentosiformis]|uniref:uncharacterized protein n=1 Tax=Nicotiana tomentosiformis TaxID=4098 RepID=UPI00388CDB33